MKELIGVIGAGTCNQNIYLTAYEVGKEIGKRGYGLICGGMGGVMEASAKGCQENGGLTIGIIPHKNKEEANPYLDIVIPTGMGIMRNLLIVRSAAVLIAIDGRYGTLSEIAFALQIGKPVIGLQTWEVSTEIIDASDAIDAVQKATERV
ncbi:MAG TPA: TIGR00725 family protein [Calditrichaeota bacterium]|nr:TIGR00725 family protein [Calditrichota bacterium]